MSSASKACEAVQYEVCTLIIAFITLMIMFKYLATTEIPVVEIAEPITDAVDFNAFQANWAALEAAAAKVAKVDTSVDLEVSFVVYLVAMISFVGWFAFSIFGGIGMVALPMDLIL